MLLVLVAQLVMGIYTLQTLTNYSQPDAVFLFPIGIVVLYLTFNYVMNRRTVAALAEAETHEQILRQQLQDQEQKLAFQHQQLQALEVERNLASQRESIMQDLHDRVGGNLTTALVQARSGLLTGDEALLVLQELAEEVRHLTKPAQTDQVSLSQLLGELRQRFEQRLRHAGIAIDWKVAPGLVKVALQTDGQHLRAMLSEAIANILKHARATRIAVGAGMIEGDRVRITIEDNGTGFVSDSVVEGRGLPGMRSRAAALGANFTLTTMAGGGTQIAMDLPVSSSERSD